MHWPMFTIVFISYTAGSVTCAESKFSVARRLSPKLVKTLVSRGIESRRRRIDNFIDAFTDEMVKLIPKSMPTPSIDKSLDVGYICAPPGSLTGLETMKKTDKAEFSLNEDRSSNVAIKYHFDKFKMLFKRFVFRFGFTKEMEVELNPTKATLIIEVKVQRRSTILKRAVRNNCVIHIARTEFTELGDVPVEVRTPDTQKQDVLKPIVEQIFKRNYELIRDCINEAVNVVVYKALKSSGALMCKDKSLEDLVLDKYVLQVNPLPKSSDYNKLCA